MKLFDSGAFLLSGRELVAEAEYAARTGGPVDKAAARQGTMAYGILAAHNKSGDMAHLRLRFDSLTSHDITYVGIIQTARAR